MALDVGARWRPDGDPDPRPDPTGRQGPRLTLSVGALSQLGRLLGDPPLPLRSPHDERRRLVSRMGGPRADDVPPGGPDPLDELARLGVVSRRPGADPDVHRDVARTVSTLALGDVHLDAVATLGPPGSRPSLYWWTAVSGPDAASLATADGRTVELDGLPAAGLGPALAGRLPTPPTSGAGEIGSPAAGLRIAWTSLLDGSSGEVGHPDADLLRAVRGRLRLVSYRGPLGSHGVDDALVHDPADPTSATWLLLGSRWHAVTPAPGRRGTDAVLRRASPADLSAAVDSLLAAAGR